MNLQRGVIRVWLVFAALWVAYSGWTFWDSCVPGNGGQWCEANGWIYELNYLGAHEVARLGLWFLGPPVGFLVLWLVGLWVTRGFSN